MPDLKAGLSSTNKLLEKKREVVSFLAGILTLRLANLLEDASQYKLLDVDIQADRLSRTMLYFEITFR